MGKQNKKLHKRTSQISFEWKIAMSWFGRIVFPTILGFGAYYVLVPAPVDQEKKLKNPEMALMGQLIRGQGAAELSTLREETKKRTREMAAEYGRQKEAEEDQKSRLAQHYFESILSQTL